jgi:hypothetical protein
VQRLLKCGRKDYEKSKIENEQGMIVPQRLREKLAGMGQTYTTTTGNTCHSSIMCEIRRLGGTTDKDSLNFIQRLLHPKIDNLNEQEAKDELKALIPHIAHLYHDLMQAATKVTFHPMDVAVDKSRHAQKTGSKNKGIERPSRQKKLRHIIIAAMKQMRLSDEKITLKELLKIWEGDANSDSFNMHVDGENYTFDSDIDGLSITETYTYTALYKMFSDAKPTV